MPVRTPPTYPRTPIRIGLVGSVQCCGDRREPRAPGMGTDKRSEPCHLGDVAPGLHCRIDGSYKVIRGFSHRDAFIEAAEISYSRDHRMQSGSNILVQLDGVYRCT